MWRTSCRWHGIKRLTPVIVFSLVIAKMRLSRYFERTARSTVLESASSFASRFRVPAMTSNVETDKHFLRTWKGIMSFRNNPQGLVRYIRPETEIVAAGSSRTCAKILDVLAALFAELSLMEDHEVMIAYGGLIHVRREEDFVNKTSGKYFDDDIDIWVNHNAMRRLVQLEPILFNKFGWTVRLYTFGSYIVFAQIVAMCGHAPVAKVMKVRENEPAIDVYPLSEVYKDNTIFLKDLWQGTIFSESMIYPTTPHELVSHIATQPVMMQLPAKDKEILSCVYGDWKARSRKHARTSLKCVSMSEESGKSN